MSISARSNILRPICLSKSFLSTRKCFEPNICNGQKIYFNQKPLCAPIKLQKRVIYYWLEFFKLTCHLVRFSNICSNMLLCKLLFRGRKLYALKIIVCSRSKKIQAENNNSEFTAIKEFYILISYLYLFFKSSNKTF